MLVTSLERVSMTFYIHVGEIFPSRALNDDDDDKSSHNGFWMEIESRAPRANNDEVLRCNRKHQQNGNWKNKNIKLFSILSLAQLMIKMCSAAFVVVSFSDVIHPKVYLTSLLSIQ